MTKNQHYIPKFYQKYWECERKGYLWALDKKHNNIRQVAITNNCSAEYLYEADINEPTNIFENYYKTEIEDKYAGEYLSLVNSRNVHSRISASDKAMVCKLFANFSARNSINLYNNPTNNFIASHFIMDTINIERGRRYIQNVMPFSNDLFESKLRSYSIQILTSDKSDIVFCDSLIEQVHYPDEYFFPICPYMTACFSLTDKGRDGLIRKITTDEYDRIIKLYAVDQRVGKIFAKDKSVLENIKRQYHFIHRTYKIPFDCEFAD